MNISTITLFFVLFLLSQSCLSFKDDTFLLSNWKLEVYPSQFNNFTIRRLNTTTTTTDNLTLTTFFLNINFTVHEGNWAGALLYQEQCTKTPYSIIGINIFKVLSEGFGFSSFGAAINYGSTCMYLSSDGYSFTKPINAWTPTNNEWFPDKDNVYCPPKSHPPDNDWFPSDLKYGLFLVLRCPPPTTSVSSPLCYGSLVISSFELIQLPQSDSTFFIIFLSISIVVTFYMMCFLFVMMINQNGLYSITTKEKLHRSMDKYLHDSISSSIHDANSISKRIFNICLTVFSINLLYTDFFTFFSLYDPSQAFRAAFVFECIGLSCTVFVACFPGGKAFRSDNAILKTEFVQKAKDLEKSPLFDESWRKKIIEGLEQRPERYVLPSNVLCVDKAHTLVATMSLVSLLIADGIYVFGKHFNESFATTIQYMIFILSTLSLIVYILYLKKEKHPKNEILLYRSESASFFGIGVLNFFLSIERNYNLQHQLLSFEIPLYTMYFIVACFILCGTYAYSKNKNWELEGRYEEENGIIG